MQNNNNTARAIAPAVIVLTITNGTPEYLGCYSSRGTRSWWIRDADAPRNAGDAFVDLGGYHPGHLPVESVTVDLVPGRNYVLGTGRETRIRFTTPSNPGRYGMSANPRASDGDRVVWHRAVSADPDPDPMTDEREPTAGWHVHGAPEGSLAYGVTFTDGELAFAALGSLVTARLVTPDEVTAGQVLVKPGPWPTTAAPVTAPPAPVRTETPPVGVHDTDNELDIPTPTPDVPVRVATPPVPSGWTVADTSVNTNTAEPTDGGFTYTSAAAATWEQGVSDVAAKRITAADDLYVAAGIVRPPTAVVLGGVVNSVGRANLIRSHAAWSTSPRTIDACDTVVRTVEEEGRQDVRTFGTLRMTGDGMIVVGRQEFYSEDGAFGDVIGLHGDALPGMARFLRQCDPQDRADIFNKYAPKDQRYDEGRAVVLRTRKVKGKDTRAIYGVVTDGYTPFDADRLATVARNALARVPGGTEARGETTYTPDDASVMIDATWHARNVHDFGAGDTISGGVRIVGNDAGGGAVRVYPTAFFNLCFNLIITARVDGDVTRIVHRGDDRSMEDRIVKAIQASARAFEPFVQAWGYMKRAPAVTLIEKPSASQGINLRAIFRTIAGAPVDVGLPVVDTRKIPDLDWRGVARDTLVEAMLSQFHNAPSNQRGDVATLADVANAVTRLHADTRIPVPVVALAERNGGLLARAWGAAA